MEKEPPTSSPEPPEGWTIIEFPARNEDARRQQEKWRHPASGRETLEQTLARLGIPKLGVVEKVDDPDDSSTA